MLPSSGWIQDNVIRQKKYVCSLNVFYANKPAMHEISEYSRVHL